MQVANGKVLKKYSFLTEETHLLLKTKYNLHKDQFFFRLLISKNIGLENVASARRDEPIRTSNYSHL